MIGLVMGVAVMMMKNDERTMVMNKSTDRKRRRKRRSKRRSRWRRRMKGKKEK